MQKTRLILILALLLSLPAGCGDDDDTPADTDAGIRADSGTDGGPSDAGSDVDAGGDVDAGRDAGVDAGSADLGMDDLGPDAGVTPDAGVMRCPALGDRTIVDVPEGPLAAGMLRWTCEHIYQLNGVVLVHSADPASPQTLTIEPGTLVRGNTSATSRGFLVVTRNGHIDADGTVEDPIVFTSAAAVGTRARDNWGGLTLLGRTAAGGTRRTEGFPTAIASIADLDPYLTYGPVGSAVADEAWDCGTLRHVRIEFASFNAGGAMGNESNALQLYSCGTETTIDFVQTHYSGDDGVEIFGGSVDIRHFVVTGASDDLFDWDDGWHGRAQFLVGQQFGDAADFGVEAGGGSDTPTSVPDPRIFNVTLVGSTTAGQIGARLRGASRGYLRNFVVLGFRDGFFDIGGAVAAANLAVDPPLLSVRNSIFAQGSAAVAWPSGSDDAADNDLIEQDFFSAATQLNRTVDPMLTRPFDTTNPSFVPLAGSPTFAANAETPSERVGYTRPVFFDTSADYVGAFAPAGIDWTAGWTAYPVN